jgi:succinate dehydrogenase / fumarate reductase flavoprotein subunit
VSYSDYTVGAPIEDTAAPGGSIDTRWERRRFGVKLVNKRKMKITVVGTGLAGGSAAATLAELGYQVSRRPRLRGDAGVAVWCPE